MVSGGLLGFSTVPHNRNAITKSNPKPNTNLKGEPLADHTVHNADLQFL